MLEEELIAQYGKDIIAKLKFCFLLVGKYPQPCENQIIQVVVEILSKKGETLLNENPAVIDWVLKSMEMLIKLGVSNSLVDFLKDKYPNN